jgi:hypothetical protein
VAEANRLVEGTTQVKKNRGRAEEGQSTERESHSTLNTHNAMLKVSAITEGGPSSSEGTEITGNVVDGSSSRGERPSVCHSLAMSG